MIELIAKFGVILLYRTTTYWTR